MCVALVSPPTGTSQIPVKPTVLCVDDSRDMLLICRTILEASGLDVLTATDGVAALEMLQRYPIDAAVIDNRMPGMNGIELVQRVKAVYKNLPILMFSDSGPEPESGAGTGIDLFLNKKRGPLAMRDAVRLLLARSSASAAEGGA